MPIITKRVLIKELINNFDMECFNDSIIELFFEKIFGITMGILSNIFREKRKMLYFNDSIQCYVNYSELKTTIQSEVEKNFMDELCPLINKKLLAKEILNHSHEDAFIDYIIKSYYTKICGLSYDLVRDIYRVKNNQLLENGKYLRDRIDYDSIFQYIEDEVNKNFN